MTRIEKQQLRKASGAGRPALALLVGLLFAVLTSAVGATPAAAGKRVGASHSESILVVGSTGSIAAGHVGVHTLPKPQVASATGVAAKAPTSQILLRTRQSLQHNFKHAGDFGVTGNYSKANAAKFSAAVHQHINSGAVRTIQGTYRGQPATHHLNPSTGLNVVSDSAGNFITGWRLSTDQLKHVTTHGGLN